MEKYIDYQYLREKKAEILRQWHEEEFEYKKELAVWIGYNATILPLKKFTNDSLLFGRAGVVDITGEYVPMSAIEKRVQYAYSYEYVQLKNETVVYCGYLVSQWGHFLVEAVSRLWYFFENNREVEKYVFVVDENAPCVAEGNYKEFFELLGIYDRIEIINKPTRYHKVIVPELGYKWRTHYSKQYKIIFETVVGNANFDETWLKREKIFLSRRKLKKNSGIEYGNDMLDEYFSKNGYYIVYPELITLSELIFLLNNCIECAAVSGTLPHNMLFASDNSKLVIVERNVLNNEIQVDVNNIKKLNVTYIDANIPIYSINLGHGPFIMAYNDKLLCFTKDKGYLAPDKKYLTRKYLKKGLIMYMKAYKKAYRYQWYMEDWSIMYCDYIREGYQAGFKCYADYLCGKQPFLWYHYLMPHYWKQICVRFLRFAVRIFHKVCCRMGITKE